MIEAQVYGGIEFIQICDLPDHQKEMILSWAKEGETIIKILKKDVLLRDCIQYKHYKQWMEEVYEPALAKEKLKEASQKSISSIKLALDR